MTIRETHEEAKRKVSQRAELVLDYLRTHGAGARVRDMAEIRAALNLPAVRDVAWALDRLHDDGRITVSRNGRVTVRDPSTAEVSTR